VHYKRANEGGDVVGIVVCLSLCPCSRLTQIFAVSQSYLYHAYAWLKLFNFSRSYNKNLTPSDTQVRAARVQRHQQQQQDGSLQQLQQDSNLQQQQLQQDSNLQQQQLQQDSNLQQLQQDSNLQQLQQQQCCAYGCVRGQCRMAYCTSSRKSLCVCYLSAQLPPGRLMDCAAVAQQW
jgi:hypothetical protein